MLTEKSVKVTVAGVCAIYNQSTRRALARGRLPMYLKP